jgi:transketolase
VAIDGDVKNSTYADKFFEAFPARAFQSYIAEQNMVGVGIGLAPLHPLHGPSPPS